MNAFEPPAVPNWERTFTATTADQTHAFGAALAGVLEAGDLLVLSGELGAGKTTFTQGLGEGLGVRAGIISPTFVLVRIHPNLPGGPRPGGPDLVHVDAYRLGSAAEIDDIDLENTLDSSVTVVEWGHDRVEHLSDSRLEIDLHRAIGLNATGLGGTGRGDSAPGDLGAGTSSGNGAGTLDFDTEDTDEPRTIVMRGYGPRWPAAPELGTPEPGTPEIGTAEPGAPGGKD
ncbi:tRNA (adenosine(37)-N6)-threonylcarbamoyltransferase complex ATPase subunit type 1 TsaE [Arthrobacter sp. Cr_A7]|uniref:tRNA (adenosine(37)-N6)-threonylcarbamoyltransferase complex ATPase subunit type 1 TsaE n=1 Tax=Arthrobacter sp. Cr_A7 TaxID=3031017 RepID=UPI0023D9C785|nr:tRNA (adenosine(37)-N6)-threonylcarbamoyltransferase complex ATPase subunit type 1 TsaE [Arthrobacter sp. Cr_A7]MDF2050875.1 tRNA (adenosine(37)-N6)-threonylcarbamoyltransferase complex ATPase subunit type 1 TsaE [Arthrobacter sp. Cr_A7]